MFRHQGKNRTAKNNLQIAVVLSFVAGIVNVVGFLFLGKLTTNVTGHFALFIYDVSIMEFWKGTIYFLYIFSFLVGSFTSGWLIETANYYKKHNIFVAPTLVECFLLFSAIVLNYFFTDFPTDITACILLFAMGVQNSFVTKISNSVVRTTHLTGLFTDLGIELSQWIYLKKNNLEVQLKKTKSNIKLRLFIIIFFFLGGLSGGFFFIKMEMALKTLFIPIIVLLLGLFYDDFRFVYLTKKRKYESKIQRRKSANTLRRQSSDNHKQKSRRYRSGRQNRRLPAQ
ncbi:YoaK family protein [Capnocytophaga cynodegmi]|uniref:YoaK family protein n=1 Tax=Capnocytophaga cynodegmi TaxID=28189 RepID=UPI001BB395C8|nr:YoaK family protein [Capnocytophaga cynodegmi]